LVESMGSVYCEQIWEVVGRGKGVVNCGLGVVRSEKVVGRMWNAELIKAS
jgi:hypothetical protein